MDDLISRQAAIDAIERLVLPQTKSETMAEEINRVAWRCAINCAEEMIGHLPSAERLEVQSSGCEYWDDESNFCTLHRPSAERRGHWIPVTERLPETTDPVNITWVNHKPSGYNEHIKDKPFVATGHYCNGRWYWFSVVCQDYLNEYGDCEMDRIDPAIEVIAWMPLPEPYKGGEKE